MTAMGAKMKKEYPSGMSPMKELAILEMEARRHGQHYGVFIAGKTQAEIKAILRRAARRETAAAARKAKKEKAPAK